MKSLSRDLLILLAGFAAVGAVAFGFSSADAGEPNTVTPTLEPSAFVAEAVTPSTTVAPETAGAPTVVAPKTTVAPVTAPQQRAAVSKPATTTSIAPAANHDVEIGTACTMTRNADGTITSIGC